MRLEQIAKEHRVSVDIVLKGLQLGAAGAGNEFYSNILDALIEDYLQLKINLAHAAKGMKS